MLNKFLFLFFLFLFSFIGFEFTIVSANYFNTGTFILGVTEEQVFMQEFKRALDDPEFKSFLDHTDVVTQFKTKKEALIGINELVNEFPYKSDQENYGVPEYWAKPSEMIEKGAGDCEDYAIMKYLMLRKAGFSTDEVHLILVHVHIPGALVEGGQTVDGYHALVVVQLDKVNGQIGKHVLLDLYDEIVYDNPFYLVLYELNEKGIKKIDDDRGM